MYPECLISPSATTIMSHLKVCVQIRTIKAMQVQTVTLDNCCCQATTFVLIPYTQFGCVVPHDDILLPRRNVHSSVEGVRARTNLPSPTVPVRRISSHFRSVPRFFFYSTLLLGTALGPFLDRVLAIFIHSRPLTFILGLVPCKISCTGTYWWILTNEAILSPESNMRSTGGSFGILSLAGGQSPG